MLFLIILSLVIILLLANQNYNIAQLLDNQNPLKIGEKAYIFNEKSLADEFVNIEGKASLLYFFSKNCPGCNEFIPTLKNYYNKGMFKQIYLIGITSDHPNIIKKFISDNQINFPIIWDSVSRIRWKYHINFVPSLVMIDSFGRIAYYQKINENPDDVLKSIIFSASDEQINKMD